MLLLYLQRWEVPGRSLRDPWMFLGVPGGLGVCGRPREVVGRIRVVAGGWCFWHRILRKSDVSVVSLGTPILFDKFEEFASPGGFGRPADTVNSI